MSVKATLAAACLTVLASNPVVAQVADAQRYLNELQLNAGPVDGAAVPKTIAAWQKFLEHRGLPLDTPITFETIAPLKGLERVDFPVSDTMDFRIVGRAFPGVDSYERDAGNPRQFCVQLKAGDFDTVDYSNGSTFEQQPGFNLIKQRAELEGPTLKGDQTYTMDLRVNVDSAVGGNFFQIHRGTRSAIFFSTYPDSMRVGMGDEIQNAAMFRGDWLDKWHKIRVVFHPASDGFTWIRTYVDGEMTLDTSDRNPHFPMVEAKPHFGLYRGSVGAPAKACYADIEIHTGDMGAPE